MVLTKDEEKILKSISVNSENDPNNPEFPPENPKFPATPTYKIKIPELINIEEQFRDINSSNSSLIIN